MLIDPRLELPVLTAPLRLEPGARRLIVRLPSKRLELPVIQLKDPRLPALRRLVGSREAQVILAPFLTKAAKQVIEAAGWGWIDASGSAHVAAKGVFVHVEKPARRDRIHGRLVVPPQGERIVRLLLDHYPSSARLSDIAVETKLDKGYTSRMLKRLRQTGLVTYESRLPVEVAFPAELFELWRTTPRRVVESKWHFSKPSRLHLLAKEIQRHAGESRAAFTGPFASSLLVGHMEVERIDCYLSDVRLAARIGEQLGGERTDRGSNVTFLSHRDPGVLTIGTSHRREFDVASVSQVYRDTLEIGRGREAELANEVRRQLLRW